MGISFYKRTGKWILRYKDKHVGYFDNQIEAQKKLKELQEQEPYDSNWGGARKGAGRPKKEG